MTDTKDDSCMQVNLTGHVLYCGAYVDVDVRRCRYTYMCMYAWLACMQWSHFIYSLPLDLPHAKSNVLHTHQPHRYSQEYPTEMVASSLRPQVGLPLVNTV